MITARKNLINVKISSEKNLNTKIVSNYGLKTKIEGKGDPGPQGEDGITFFPEIETVETLGPNEKAKVSIRIENDKMLFSFKIPQGAKGDMDINTYDSNKDGIVNAAETTNKIGDLTKEDLLKKFIDVNEKYDLLDRAFKSLENSIAMQFDTMEKTPVGTTAIYAGVEDPIGWLICDGREVSRQDYSNLFNVISTAFGEGDGISTFNIPNLQEMTVIGRSDTDADYSTLGNRIGSKAHTLTVDELAEHTHEVTVSTNGVHAHNTYNVFAFNHSTGATTTRVTGESGDGRGNPTDLAGEHSHIVTVGNTGNNQSFSVVQPSMIMNYIIKY